MGFIFQVQDGEYQLGLSIMFCQPGTVAAVRSQMYTGFKVEEPTLWTWFKKVPTRKGQSEKQV